MKVVFQAFIGSIILHVFYFVSTMIVGSIKTSQYKPGIENAWGQAETLQNEVVFGKVISPSVYLLSLVGVALICGIIIFSYKKIFMER
ncbi:hypothetical protein ACFTQL_06070 [Peribacillus butanolivorans]|uniref:hypothetical protein n=1 Tax=Peribacillus butanolivorans TaxID=421767 RepID=UPI00207C9BE0|nr:hypothetical protein [Peribacillus butanolivorans]MCO0599674.1 hypothetical protein [Peribacillus butanolivorans]